MMDLHITMKETSDLTEKDIKSLIELKQQYWRYTDEEQRNWFNENIKEDDYHLMIYRDGVLLAYLNAVNVNVSVNRSLYKMLGIGNVCVNKEYVHSGVGSILMACINASIREMNTSGILLCKEKLIDFYRASNWVEIVPKKTMIFGRALTCRVMIYDFVKIFDNNVTKQLEFFRSF